MKAMIDNVEVEGTAEEIIRLLNWRLEKRSVLLQSLNKIKRRKYRKQKKNKK